MDQQNPSIVVGSEPAFNFGRVSHPTTTCDAQVFQLACKQIILRDYEEKVVSLRQVCDFNDWR